MKSETPSLFAGQIIKHCKNIGKNALIHYHSFDSFCFNDTGDIYTMAYLPIFVVAITDGIDIPQTTLRHIPFQLIKASMVVLREVKSKDILLHFVGCFVHQSGYLTDVRHWVFPFQVKQRRLAF